MEAAEKEAKGLQDVPGASVNRLGRGIPVRKQPTLRPDHNTPNQPQKALLTASCYRCGAKHKASDCKFREAECHYCKKGHIAKVYLSKAKAQQNQMRTGQLH